MTNKKLELEQELDQDLAQELEQELDQDLAQELEQTLKKLNTKKEYIKIDKYFKVLNYSPKYKKYLIQINKDYTTWVSYKAISPKIVNIVIAKNDKIWLYDDEKNILKLSVDKFNKLINE